MKRLIAWVTMVAFVSGCATHKSQAVPDFGRQAGQLKKIGVVVDAQVNYRSFGGNKSTELSAQASKNLEAAAVRELTARGYSATVLPENDETRAFLGQYKDIRGDLYRPFRETGGEIAGVEPVPGVARLAKKAGVDSIVIVTAEDSATSVGLKLVAVAVFVGVVAIAVLDPWRLANGNFLFFDRGSRKNTEFNADFAVLDKNGKIMFHERSSLSLADKHSIALASATFADDVKAKVDRR